MTDPLSRIDELTARLDELYAKATGGEWAIRAERYRFIHVYSPLGGIAHMDTIDAEGTATAALIAALHNAWPELRAEIERLRGDGWIPVSERLPEDGKDILVVDSGEVRIIYCVDRGLFEEAANSGFYTHWQPLPAAREQGKGER